MRRHDVKAKTLRQLRCQRCDWKLGPRTLVYIIQVGQYYYIVHTWSKCFSLQEDVIVSPGQIADDGQHVRELDGNQPFLFP